MEKVEGDHLLCPICFELPESEVYQCKNGHPICKRCCKDVKSCPQCRVPFETVKIRNRALEALLESMVVDCPYAKEGCKVLPRRKEAHLHTKSCLFKPIQLCKLLGIHKCAFASSQPSLIFDHIIHQHRTKQLVGSTKLMYWRNFSSFVGSNVRRNRFRTSVWELGTDQHSERFVLTMMLDMEFEEFSTICLYMGNSRQEVTRFTFTVGIIQVHENAKKAKWTWTGEPTYFKDADNLMKNPPFRVPIQYMVDNFGSECSDGDFDLILEVSIQGTAKEPVGMTVPNSTPKPVSERIEETLAEENKKRSNAPLLAKEFQADQSSNNFILFSFILVIFLYFVKYNILYIIVAVFILYLLRRLLA